MAAFQDKILNESTWGLFLHEVALALSDNHVLNMATLAITPSHTPNTFVISPHHSVKAGLTYSYELTAAHVNDLRIKLSRSSSSSPELDRMEGQTPHYNGGTHVYEVHGIRQAVEMVMHIAHETFVNKQFPMDPRHREPEYAAPEYDSADDHHFSQKNQDKRQPTYDSDSSD